MSPRQVLATHNSAELGEWMAFFIMKDRRREAAEKSDTRAEVLAELAGSARGNRQSAKSDAKRKR